MPKRRRTRRRRRHKRRSKRRKYDWKSLVIEDKLNRLCKFDLQIYLRKYNLKVSGRKQILIDRIKKHKQNEMLNRAIKRTRSIFTHPNDHIQFVSILISIRHSKIAKVLSIPSVINTLIAQYATGQMHHCTDAKCSNEITFLHADYPQLIEEDVFRHAEDFDDYFCSVCKYKTIRCQHCNIPRWKPSSTFCENCDHFICFNQRCPAFVSLKVWGFMHLCSVCGDIYCGQEPTGCFMADCPDCHDLVCWNCEEYCHCVCELSGEMICTKHMISVECSCGAYIDYHDCDLSFQAKGFDVCARCNSALCGECTDMKFQNADVCCSKCKNV